MKKSFIVCSLMATLLAACGSGGTTRTPPTVQRPNTTDIRLPNGGSTSSQNIPVLAQPTVHQAPAVQAAAPVVQQQPTTHYVPQSAVPSPSQYNHASVANAGTTAVDDYYVRASTEVFSCNNGSTVTIKHLEADTITIALDSTKGNSILKLTSSGAAEVYRAKAALFGKPTEWQQQNAQAVLGYMDGKNQVVRVSCSLKR